MPFTNLRYEQYVAAVISRHKLEGGARLQGRGTSRSRDISSPWANSKASKPLPEVLNASSASSSAVSPATWTKGQGRGGPPRASTSSSRSGAVLQGQSVQSRTAGSGLPLRPSTTMALVRSVEMRPPSDMEVRSQPRAFPCVASSCGNSWRLNFSCCCANTMVFLIRTTELWSMYHEEEGSSLPAAAFG